MSYFCQKSLSDFDISAYYCSVLHVSEGKCFKIILLNLRG